MRKIRLSNSPEVALVDDDDYELASRYRWRVRRSKHRNARYVTASTRNGEIHLHRLLLQPLPGQLVDHRDGNGLNNCRSNLRACNATQNLANRPPSKRNRTGYKGVAPAAGDRYRARIHHRGVERSLGHFRSAEAAARAYDAEALLVFGEFAYLNFPAERQAVSA